MSGSERTDVQITQSEKEALLEQFKQCDFSLSEFARSNNIKVRTFRNWIYIKKKSPNLRKRYSPVERKKIVESFLISEMTRAQFAKAWGVSGGSIGNWVYRYNMNGADGLLPPPRKSDDKRVGMRISKGIRTEIIDLKKQEPSFGFKKIKNWLYRFRGVKVSTGSIRKTMVAEGLPNAQLPKKRRRSSDKIRRFERAVPMQLWQSDITQFTLGPSSMRVYLTVFMDDHSRYIVGWRLQSRQTADLVMDAFSEAMVRFGKPQEVLTDQGRQYFAWRGKSELEKKLESEGIKHVVSRSHHPQTLGKCERFWETVYNEFWTRAKPQDLDEARQRMKYFIDHYNHQRPHQGISGMTPADRFFGVAQEVREIIEKTVAENSLRLALEEQINPPSFLIGQIGDQRIAFHGTTGQFYLTKESLFGEQNANNTLTNNSTSTSVSDYAIKRATDEEAPQTEGYSAEELLSNISFDTSEGIMGPCEGRRSWTSENICSENTGIMDGDHNEGGSSSES